MKKKSPQKLHPSKLAFSIAILVATATLFATILVLISPNITTITPLLQLLYGTLGYKITATGALLGALYTFIDIFILIYLFAWLYNKLL